MTESSSSVRLNKFLALALGFSRRQADDLIAQGDVTIDGEVAVLGARFDPATQKILVKGKPVATDTKFRYIAFNKPVGYVCSRRAQGDAPTIYDLLPSDFRAYKPVGRLDKDSSGLILLTNDGDFAHTMTHPSFHKTKQYEVTLDHDLEPLHRQMISDHGVMLDDGPSKLQLERLDGHITPEDHTKRVTRDGATPTEPSKARENGVARAAGPAPSDLRADFASAKSNDGSGNSKEADDTNWIPDRVGNDTRWIVQMHEGRNRQIRRTFAALGYEVTALHRTRFGVYELNALKPGEFTDISL